MTEGPNNAGDGPQDNGSLDSINRRKLLKGILAVTTAEALTAAAMPAAQAAAQPRERSRDTKEGQLKPLDIAEYSWALVGVKRGHLARGTVSAGDHVAIEYWIPERPKYRYPIVLVHGGSGQALDWMGTPDGRRGWAFMLLEEGYKVYVVDRPAQGRNVFDPAMFGRYGPAPTYEEAARNVAALARHPASNPNASAHSQWPGTAELDDPALEQFVASLGPSYPPTVLNRFNYNSMQRSHEVWRSTSAALLDKIGPAVLVTHGDSSPFAWLAADERPQLVKGIVAIEPTGPAFSGPLTWGLTAARINYDPPAATAQEMNKTPRRLKNLAAIPIAVVTAEASEGAQRDPATVDFLRQAGCTVDHVRLAEEGVRGNGPYMMLEKNNRQALKPILSWFDQRLTRSATAERVEPIAPTPTAMKLADTGFFWTGVKRKQLPYGTVASGQMFVQYYTPKVVRYPYPIVFIHGGGGTMTHYLNILQHPGWVHYFVQEGYRVYNVDRPGSGRSPYHPEGIDYGLLGRNARLHQGMFNTYEELLRDTQSPQWPYGTTLDDPSLDQFVPLEITPPQFEAQAIDAEVFLNAGVELLDKIGPAIVHTFAYSGQLGWALADRRPGLVKGIITIEPNDSPFMGQAKWGLTSVPVSYDPPVADASELSLVDGEPAGPSATPYKLQAAPARRLKNLQGVPIGWFTGQLRSDSHGENTSPGGIAFLRQAGCTVEDMALKKLGILGNGNLGLWEKNNREFFNAMRDWLARSVAKPGASG